MGQQTSLNCRSTPKQQQYQIQTTHTNALNLYRKEKQENLASEVKSTTNKSLAIKNQSKNISKLDTNSNVSLQKNHLSLMPQHENILKVSYSPFAQCDKIDNKYIQKMVKTLSEVIQPRYNTAMHLPQAQIVMLIESLVYSLAYMQKYDYKHHDFYPSNVYYNNGIFKIINPLMIDCSGYNITQQRKRFSFLSPELIAEILDETDQAQIPIEVMIKSDIFSIGMIALECCTLLPSAECYDQENYSIIDKVIKERLAKTAKLYSPVIADCIAEMLRISISELALLVFLNSPQEKIIKESEQPQTQQPVKVQQVVNMPPVPPSNNAPQIRQPYMQNPPHVQQQFLILPPGQLPPNQMNNLPTVQQILPLNDNNIALPAPNYNYSRIGPNNQGLLSPTTLQNKLKVIELIHQKAAYEEESDAHFSGVPSYANSNSNNKNLAPLVQKQLIIPQNRYNQQHINQNPPINAQASPKVNKIEEQAFKYSLNTTKPNNIKQHHYSSQRNVYQNRFTDVPAQTLQNYMNTNKYQKKDENGETLEERVERILQMSRNIK